MDLLAFVLPEKDPDTAWKQSGCHVYLRDDRGQYRQFTDFIFREEAGIIDDETGKTVAFRVFLEWECPGVGVQNTYEEIPIEFWCNGRRLNEFFQSKLLSLSVVGPPARWLSLTNQLRSPDMHKEKRTRVLGRHRDPATPDLDLWLFADGGIVADRNTGECKPQRTGLSKTLDLDRTRECIKQVPVLTEQFPQEEGRKHLFGDLAKIVHGIGYSNRFFPFLVLAHQLMNALMESKVPILVVHSPSGVGKSDLLLRPLKALFGFPGASLDICPTVPSLWEILNVSSHIPVVLDDFQNLWSNRDMLETAIAAFEGSTRRVGTSRGGTREATARSSWVVSTNAERPPQPERIFSRILSLNLLEADPWDEEPDASFKRFRTSIFNPQWLAQMYKRLARCFVAFITIGVSSFADAQLEFPLTETDINRGIVNYQILVATALKLLQVADASTDNWFKQQRMTPSALCEWARSIMNTAAQGAQGREEVGLPAAEVDGVCGFVSLVASYIETRRIILDDKTITSGMTLHTKKNGVEYFAFAPTDFKETGLLTGSPSKVNQALHTLFDRLGGETLSIRRPPKTSRLLYGVPWRNLVRYIKLKTTSIIRHESEPLPETVVDPLLSKLKLLNRRWDPTERHPEPK